MLMSDAGSTTSQFNPVNNVTLTFDASAATAIPDATQITSGTYRPANYAGLGTADTFPPPAPPIPYTNTALSVFNDLSPNGNWSLFVVDDTSLGSGSIAGWSLSIQTSDPVSPSAGLFVADLSVAATAAPNPAAVGAEISCVIQVTNRGPGTANSAALLDNLPASLTFVSANATVGSWSKVGGTFRWNIGSMASGGAARLTMVVRPVAVGTIAHTLMVSANQTDPNPTDNSITLSTTVVPVPALSVSRQVNNLRITWPADSGFKLQVADNLRPEAWADVGGTPSVLNGQNVVTVGITGPTKFYRLRSP